MSVKEQLKSKYDLLLLYFVGHGLVEQAGRLYLAAVDTVPEALAETAIPAAYLASWMNRSFSRQQILILDCVYIQIAQDQPIPTSAISSAGASINATFRGRGFGRIVLTGTDTIPYVFAGDGAITAPIVILVFGWEADFRASIGLAGLFLLLYAFLYWALD